MPAMRRAVKLWFTLILLIGPLPALAFGPTGHRIAGAIAEAHLCPEARSYIAPLLDGTSLANAGVWADWIRDDPAWAKSKPWHYLNAGDDEPLDRAVRRSPDNVLTAIERLEREISDTRRSREERAEALRFFVHFLADVHQPLHIGRADDRGGNGIDVEGAGKRRSLHSLWDAEWLLGRDRLDLSAQVQAVGALAAGQLRSWQSGSAREWAEESRALRPLVYGLPAAGGDGRIRVDRTYLVMARNIVQQRLAQAGVRLAWRLNRVAGCPE